MEKNKSNLIINYLPQSLTDNEFHSMFAALGTLVSCKIIRDKTGYSHGYGFVEYVNHEDALKAIAVLNGYHIQNKVMKVAFARPKGDESKNCKLYIKGIPTTLTEDILYRLFAPYGEIVQVRIPNEGVGTNGVAFVLYSKHSEAQAAVQNLNKQIPPGFYEPLKVQFALDDQQSKKPIYSQHVGRQDTQPPGPIRPQGNFNRMNRYNPMGGIPLTNQPFHPSQSSTSFAPRSMSGNPRLLSSKVNHSAPVIFVYNIGQNATEDEVWQLFQVYGIVQKVNVVQDRALGNCRGFAFVTMADEEQAKYAIECLDGSMYKNKKLQVRFKNEQESKCQEESKCQVNLTTPVVFVYNIGEDATEDDMWHLFQPYGTVQKVDVVYDKILGKCRGFAFVTMADPWKAKYAIECLNGSMYGNKKLQVRFKSEKEDK